MRQTPFLSTLFLIVIATTLSAQITDLPFGQKGGWEALRLSDPIEEVTVEQAGSTVLRVASPFTEYESGGAYQMLPLPGKKLTKYKLTGKMCTEGVAGEGATVYLYATAGEQRYLNYTATKALMGNQDWTDINLDFIGDKLMDSVRLGCYLDGTGTAWFKDMKWETTPLSDVAPPGKAAKAYLKKYFRIAQKHALHTEDIDWPNLKQTAALLAGGVATPAETYPALAYVTKKINRHSKFLDPETAGFYTGSSGGEDEEEDARPPVTPVTGELIDDRVAYLNVPSYLGGDPDRMQRFTDAARRLIDSLDGPSVTGWIVDLRENGGGNCWPMLAALSPLLGEGTLGYFMDPDGEKASAWIARAGKVYQDKKDNGGYSEGPYVLKASKVKVAVLTGPQTASSGEVVAVAFRGMPNTRSFGAPTAGYSTTNNFYPLPDGAVINLTISIYGDRNKVAYGEEIEPDVVAEDAVKQAMVWLRK